MSVLNVLTELSLFNCTQEFARNQVGTLADSVLTLEPGDDDDEKSSATARHRSAPLLADSGAEPPLATDSVPKRLLHVLSSFLMVYARREDRNIVLRSRFQALYRRQEFSS